MAIHLYTVGVQRLSHTACQLLCVPTYFVLLCKRITDGFCAVLFLFAVLFWGRQQRRIVWFEVAWSCKGIVCLSEVHVWCSICNVQLNIACVKFVNICGHDRCSRLINWYCMRQRKLVNYLMPVYIGRFPSKLRKIGDNENCDAVLYNIFKCLLQHYCFFPRHFASLASKGRCNT